MLTVQTLPAVLFVLHKAVGKAVMGEASPRAQTSPSRGCCTACESSAEAQGRMWLLQVDWSLQGQGFGWEVVFRCRSEALRVLRCGASSVTREMPTKPGRVEHQHCPPRCHVSWLFSSVYSPLTSSDPRCRVSTSVPPVTMGGTRKRLPHRAIRQDHPVEAFRIDFSWIACCISAGARILG